MLGLEPKDLPVGTTISMESNGRYVKDRIFGVTAWLQGNGDTLEVIFDEPTAKLVLKVDEAGYIWNRECSQDFFGMDWSIVSVPWHFAVMLAKAVHEYESHEWQLDQTSDDTLRTAFKEYTKAEEEAK